MLKRALLAVLITVAPAIGANAEPAVKVINFTAEWCPNCQILNPRLEEAIAAFPDGDIERVDLDMTDARGPRKTDIYADAIRLADSHQAGYLWDWYGGVTGIAAIISADNGEPIACVNRSLEIPQIEARLKQALILARRAPPGVRMPDGPDCPPPLR